jgi:mono/diheme cytochrome c family protein
MRKPFLALLPFVCSAAFAANDVQFNRDIRPLLADNCFHCHGPDPGTRKAGLRLDTEAGFFAPRADKSGKEEPPTIIKGKPDQSTLYQRMLSKDEDEIMPPPETHKTLKPDQIALVRRWIEQGAPWQPHWSLVPPQKFPSPKTSDDAWAKNPVDRFVRAKLDDAGLKPAPEADAPALIRRVSLDVTGLPPSPALLAKHLPKDGSRLSDAQLSALIDELMALPAYGEHRARYWLDAARYADSHGLHFDAYREMWPYRDWVVKAFNDNLSFDKFTVWQLAGDLLPNPTEEQRIATGLQRCNVTTNEGGTIVEENLANYAADRVQTMGWVYLGLTTNCAQCHDHKFDPFTQKDFYSMAAFFRNTTQGGLDGNVKDGRGPVLYLPSPADRPRWEALPGEIAKANEQVAASRKAGTPLFDRWIAAAKPADLDADIPAKGLIARLALNEGKGIPAGTQAAGEPIAWKKDGKSGPAPSFKKGSHLVVGEAGDFGTKQAFSVGAWTRVDKAEGAGTILARMDDAKGSQGWSLFQSGKNFGVYVISKWPDDAIKVTTSRNPVRAGAWQHVFMTYDGSGKASGVKIYVDGVAMETRAEVDKLKTDTKAATPTRLGQRSRGEPLHGDIQEAFLYSRALRPEEVTTLSKLAPLRAMLAGKPGPKQKDALRNHFLSNRHEPSKVANALVAKLTAEQTMIRARSPLTHVQEEKMDSPAMANILIRGAYDKKGDAVPAEIPSALGKLPTDAPRNRLGLARWIVSEANPLTARVSVNRMWQELFGAGLVKTSEDFGIMGSLPSHPELLDWLAIDFREHGWDVKRFYKQLLLSATYRQAALITKEKIDKDRDNALLSRGPRFRMDAEMLRDQALAVSGTLSPRMGGPGTKPYQPENIWEVVGVGIQVYRPDTGENLYRRSLYNYWRRMAPPASLDLFNAPSREVTCVRRDRTNTPLQALVMLNDPQYVEASRVLAQHTLKGPGDDRARLHAAAGRVLCRPLKPAETAILADSLAKMRKHYVAQPADAAALLGVGDAKADDQVPRTELAAWTMVCSQLLNLDETLNK